MQILVPILVLVGVLKEPRRLYFKNQAVVVPRQLRGTQPKRAEEYYEHIKPTNIMYIGLA
jgi:hypothetical protein